MRMRTPVNAGAAENRAFFTSADFRSQQSLPPMPADASVRRDAGMVALIRRGDDGLPLRLRIPFDRRYRFRQRIFKHLVEGADRNDLQTRSEEHTSELQSLMRTSYAVFCLKKKNKQLSSTSYNNQQSNATTITT